MRGVHVLRKSAIVPSAKDTDLPDALFVRVDESPDVEFYREPRFVAHIDDATMQALTEFYRSFIPDGGDVVDLMSSWISHLPTDKHYGRVAGLGMNAAELAANPQLSDHRVHDLNIDPCLPYADDEFDRAAIAVSIQYLIKPVDVLKSTGAALRPGGKICIAMSHRLFPTKAIIAFQRLPPVERVRLVSSYLELAGFIEVHFLDQSPANADPLWLVVGTQP
jgi:SAM-dependent methyltransferase